MTTTFDAERQSYTEPWTPPGNSEAAEPSSLLKELRNAEQELAASIQTYERLKESLARVRSLASSK